MIKKISGKVLDMIFPPSCLLCEERAGENGSLCFSCWSKISFISKPSCAICCFPFEYDMGKDALCPTCIANKPEFEKAIPVFIYNKNSSRLITEFKYADRIHATKSFAKWMSAAAIDIIKNSDLIAPVPLHKSKLFARRYNQSALIANEIGKMAKIKVMPDLLLHPNKTRPQASLPKKQRLKNVKGIFSLNSKYADFISGKNILIVDDVITTGATLSECARILKKKKTAVVNAVTLAKTIPGEN